MCVSQKVGVQCCSPLVIIAFLKAVTTDLKQIYQSVT